MAAGPTLATLPLLDAAGTPAALRVLLPPNLAVAATRDAIVVRFEIAVHGRGRCAPAQIPRDRALAVSAPQLAAVFLVESWNRGAMPAFAQLTRAQLAALLAVLRDEPVFFFANKPEAPMPWRGEILEGVSEHLASPSADSGRSAIDVAGTHAGTNTREFASAPSSSRGTPSSNSPKTAGTSAPASNATPPVIDGSEHFLAIQLPAREHPAYAPLLELLKSDGFRLETSNRKWWLRDRHRALGFLARHWARLENEWQARFTDNFRKNTAHIRFAEIACETTAAGDDFEVSLALRAGAASDREVGDALATGRGYVESNGRLFLIDAEKLAALHDTQRALAGATAHPLLARSTHRVARARVAEADALLETLSPNLQTPEEWRRRTAIFRHPEKLPPAPASPALDAQLRAYQRLGAAWLWHLRRNGLGGILADEMGLGKTLQALALVTAIRRDGSSGASGPCLVVCPASLLENWRREAARFAPELRVRVHHGDARTKDAAALRGVDLVVTSYGTLARDQEFFQTLPFDTLIADEAQHVKNRRTQNAQALQSVRAPGRVLLTGTPVENSLADLESLFAVILPGYLKPIPGDARGEDRTWHEARVRRQAAPYVLRRTKAQVTPELPPKIEQVLFIELTETQRALYEAMRVSTENELMRLAASGQSEARIRVAMFTQLLRLRQICGDPRLLEPARDAAESAKLAAFLELIDEAVDDGHRVLVFSQFTSLLALVRAELDARETAYCYLDGAMPARARQAEVDRFNTTPSVPLFLLSLKAGGTGLNLATADTVVHLDPWWNPAVEAQATDRAHRIGQTRVVTSYKLIAAGTVEERVLAMQQQKRALLANVFDESDAANAALTLDDLRALVAG